MAFEGLICPNCSSELDEKQIRGGDLKCPHCRVNIKQKKYLAFLEYLMMNGLVDDIDFFDQKFMVMKLREKLLNKESLMIIQIHQIMKIKQRDLRIMMNLLI